ncbi:unnamed protein product [Camellia sinensis]
MGCVPMCLKCLLDVKVDSEHAYRSNYNQQADCRAESLNCPFQRIKLKFTDIIYK